MAIETHRGKGVSLPTGNLGLAVLVLFLTCLATAGVLVMGFWMLALVAWVGLGAACFFIPERAVLGLIVVAGAFEAGAVDFTGPIGDSLHGTPPAVAELVPFTTSPFELMLLAMMGGLLARWTSVAVPTLALPLVAKLFPVFIGLGMAYGIYKGAPSQLVYHEARGLIFAAIAFLITWRLSPSLRNRQVERAILGATVLLASIILLRYVGYTRGGAISSEAAFAHEDSILLGIGFVVAFAAMVREQRHGRMALLALVQVLVICALIATTRRSATLVLLVALLTTAALMFRHRPALVVAAAIPLLLLGSLYMVAYWNQEYGALAQPARAIRSQVDPSPRDDSSDRYREIETMNVLETIRNNRVFGVGFGVPFAGYQPLPDLTSFWPLQWYSPHNNILWLWLKLGALGAAAAMSLWVIALGRTLSRVRENRSLQMFPIILAAILVMYFTFARVDLAFLGARSAVPLGVVLALAFATSRGSSGREAESAVSPFNDRQGSEVAS